jgi:hypothetical protein
VYINKRDLKKREKKGISGKGMEKYKRVGRTLEEKGGDLGKWSACKGLKVL